MKIVREAWVAGALGAFEVFGTGQNVPSLVDSDGSIDIPDILGVLDILDIPVAKSVE